ncbi:MAG TPA: bifunctional DNA-formamidopyrimidine glycosylase/DNA-(apurinic or apyrimidinic site) lyase [Alphaproteobacteria bacterium]|jgi:formamidopyrimidine-DNA glycosylase|nr:bifunctional DNA-formamidopyrimidine glycosylase/DNA-(apurinic or apyrimidinic site) lyase [Alphaproteobacteria bacterium]
MPELPEVEAIKTQLGKFLPGHKIASIDVKDRRVFQGDEKQVIGAKVLGTRRFGKVTVIDLDNKFSILTHVKLTGQFIYRGPNLKNPSPLSKKVAGGIPGPHTLVIFNLDRGGELYYNDIRRFGWVRIIKTEDVEKEKFIVKLGPEPLKDLTLDIFKNVLSKTKRPIKVVLMDQTKMGGIGNIYASDALWLSGIDPKRPSSSLTAIETKNLYDSIVTVLKEGIKSGGASELSFVTPDGTEGHYQDFTLVYGKEGTLCKRCKTEKIVKYFLAGRGTYVCPRCQK